MTNPFATDVIPAFPPNWPGFDSQPFDPARIDRTALATGGNYLFNRRWQLSLNTPVPWSTNALRIEFELERTTFSTSNKGKISVYNMGDKSRQQIIPQNTLINLMVGYGFDNSAPLYTLTTAVVWTAITKRKNAELVTEFELAEAGQDIMAKTVNMSFPAGTTNTAVISFLVGQLSSVTLGPVVDLTETSYTRGFTLTGSVKDNLDKILTPQRLAWHVVNTVLYIHPKTKSPVGTVVLVNENTGLLGTPNLSQPDGAAKTVLFETLINPKIIPGSAVKITSRLIDTFVTVNNIKYNGDTHGSKWTQTCEATPTNSITEVVGPPPP